jgi:hypothetical protein
VEFHSSYKGHKMSLTKVILEVSRTAVLNTVEEVIKINSTGQKSWVCFARSDLQVVTHMIRLELI